jgi:sugar/nucleoside kinase (ribokinase family)
MKGSFPPSRAKTQAPRAEHYMSDTTHRVTGIGNAIVDVLALADDAFLKAESLDKGAMTLVSERRALELYDGMREKLERSGGSAGNTMAGLASLGSRVGYIGKVKNDPLGEVFGSDLRKAGVTFQTPPLLDGPSTARCLIFVTPDAQRTMNTYLGACSELYPSDVDAGLIRQSQVTYLEGYLFDRPHAKDAFRKAAEIAHSSERKVALSLSDAFCVDRHRGEFLELVEHHVDILFANEREILSLYQCAEFDRAVELVRGHCEVAVLTRSEKGGVIISAHDPIVMPAEPVAQVIDTTGAGDLYAAGFLHGYTEGRDLGLCARYGALAAAEVISHFGARPETPLSEFVHGKL